MVTNFQHNNIFNSRFAAHQSPEMERPCGQHYDQSSATILHVGTTRNPNVFNIPKYNINKYKRYIQYGGCNVNSALCSNLSTIIETSRGLLLNTKATHIRFPFKFSAFLTKNQNS